MHEDSWGLIARKISGRSHTQCRHRWKNVLDPSLPKGSWADKEDVELVRFCGLHGNQLQLIAEDIPGCSDSQCRSPSLIVVGKEPWSPTEDAVLRSLHSALAPDWNTIADDIPGRSGLQCRYRGLIVLVLPVQGDARSERKSLSCSPATKYARTDRNAKSSAEESIAGAFKRSAALEIDGLVRNNNPFEHAVIHRTSVGDVFHVTENRGEDIVSPSTSANNHEDIDGGPSSLHNSVLSPAKENRAGSPSTPVTAFTADQNQSKVSESTPMEAYMSPAVPGNQHFLRNRALSEIDWSSAEDTSLMCLRRIHGTNWRRIAQQMDGRTAPECSDRWVATLQVRITQGPWTRSEDDELTRLHGMHGHNWSLIGQLMDGRSIAQCSPRWSFVLKPGVTYGS